MRAIVATLLLLALVTGAAAEPNVTGFNVPSVDGNVGETFEVKFEIRSDNLTNYTIKLTPRAEFNFTPTEKTIEIPEGDTRTFIFEGELTEALEDGKYAIQWEAYQNGTQFDSGSLDLRAGEQAPAPGFALAAAALAGLALATRWQR